MKHIDPAMANRVWQRVQASLKPPCAPDSQPLPVYTTPPEDWLPPEAKKPRRPVRCRYQNSAPPLLWLALLFLLLSKQCC